MIWPTLATLTHFHDRNWSRQSSWSWWSWWLWLSSWSLWSWWSRWSWWSSSALHSAGIRATSMLRLCPICSPQIQIRITKQIRTHKYRFCSNCTKKIFIIRGKCLLGKSKIYCKTNPELGGIGCSICVQFALHEEILSKLGFQNMKMESTNWIEEL